MNELPFVWTRVCVVVGRHAHARGGGEDVLDGVGVIHGSAEGWDARGGGGLETRAVMRARDCVRRAVEGTRERARVIDVGARASRGADARMRASTGVLWRAS